MSPVIINQDDLYHYAVSYEGEKMTKKKLLLRISPKLHEELRNWADADFRSINSQIEFLLQKAVAENRREKNDA